MHANGQTTGMAGEFLVLGKLFKRGYQASITFGNAKAVDLFVYNDETREKYLVQVKSLRKKNCFPLKRDNVDPSHIYVFVILNEPEEEEDYYLITGEELLSRVDHY